MTLTERNQKLYELRNKLLMKRAEVKMVEQQIYSVRQQYKNEQMDDLYSELFSN